MSGCINQLIPGSSQAVGRVPENERQETRPETILSPAIYIVTMLVALRNFMYEHNAIGIVTASTPTFCA